MEVNRCIAACNAGSCQETGRAEKGRARGKKNRHSDRSYRPSVIHISSFKNGHTRYTCHIIICSKRTVVDSLQGLQMLKKFLHFFSVSFHFTAALNATWSALEKYSDDQLKSNVMHVANLLGCITSSRFVKGLNDLSGCR